MFTDTEINAWLSYSVSSDRAGCGQGAVGAQRREQLANSPQWSWGKFREGEPNFTWVLKEG